MNENETIDSVETNPETQIEDAIDSIEQASVETPTVEEVQTSEPAADQAQETAPNTEKPKKKSSTSKTKKEKNVVAVKNPPAKKPAPKTAPKPVKTPKKPTAPPKGKAEANGRGPSIRLRTFQLLAKSADGLTGREIMEKLGLSGIPALLKDEGCSDQPRIRREVAAEGRAVVYKLTAAGKKAVEKDTVDSEPAPKASGKDWPNGR